MKDKFELTLEHLKQIERLRLKAVISIYEHALRDGISGRYDPHIEHELDECRLQLEKLDPEIPL